MAKMISLASVRCALAGPVTSTGWWKVRSRRLPCEPWEVDYFREASAARHFAAALAVGVAYEIWAPPHTTAGGVKHPGGRVAKGSNYELAGGAGRLDKVHFTPGTARFLMESAEHRGNGPERATRHTTSVPAGTPEGFPTASVRVPLAPPDRLHKLKGSTFGVRGVVEIHPDELSKAARFPYSLEARRAWAEATRIQPGRPALDSGRKAGEDELPALMRAAAERAAPGHNARQAAVVAAYHEQVKDFSFAVASQADGRDLVERLLRAEGLSPRVRAAQAALAWFYESWYEQDYPVRDKVQAGRLLQILVQQTGAVTDRLREAAAALDWYYAEAR